MRSDDTETENRNTLPRRTCQMLSLKDCIDLSNLSDAEVAAIAEHEHVPEIVAAEIGCELINTAAGRLVLKQYIRENMRHAKAQHLSGKAKALELLLRRFDRAHPPSAHSH